MVKRSSGKPPKRANSCLTLLLLGVGTIIAVSQCGRVGSHSRPSSPEHHSSPPVGIEPPTPIPLASSDPPPLASKDLGPSRASTEPSEVGDSTLVTLEKYIQSLKVAKVLARIDFGAGRISVNRREWGAYPYEERRSMAENLSRYRKLQRDRDKIELWDDTRHELVARYSTEAGYWEKEIPHVGGGGTITPTGNADSERGCKGDPDCAVCKNCSSCGHCSKRGGHCGACR